MPKKSSGLGGYGGTLGEPFENEDGEPYFGWGTADGEPPKGLMKGDPSTQPKPRNIVTGPGKKGGYGMRGYTLGEKKGAGVGGRVQVRRHGLRRGAQGGRRAGGAREEADGR